MKWNNIKTTIIKEIRTIFRDKKSMTTLITLPLIIPFFIFLMGFMEETMLNDAYNVGINYNATLTEKSIAYEYGDFKLVTYNNEEELKKAYSDGEIKAYIIKEDKKYTIYSSSSNTSGAVLSSSLYLYLEAYNSYLGVNYLISQDIDTDLVFKNIETKLESIDDEGDNNAMVTMLLSISISYVLMIIALSTITVATDSTAGEKERGTLETLLTFPIKSSEIITGKYLSISLFGIFFGFVSLALIIPSLSIAKVVFTSFDEISFNFSFISIVYAVLIIILDSFLSAGICMALAGRAKTYKEAQSSLQYVSMLSMLPMICEMFEVSSSYFYLIPLANCGFALDNLLLDKFDTLSLVVMFVSSILYIVIIIFIISKQYKSEKTLFS